MLTPDVSRRPARAQKSTRFSRRQMFFGVGALGVSALALEGRRTGPTLSGSSFIKLPTSAKPSPAPSPTPTSAGVQTINPQKFYKPEHGDNWRPALQEAFTTAAKQNKEVILERDTYNCWQQDQTNATGNIHADYLLSLFWVEQSIRMRSVNSLGSRIIQRAPDGSLMGPNNYKALPGGLRARGGGFVMRSTTTAPYADPSLLSFTSHKVLFDFGLRRSMNLGFDPETPNKGFWQANDRNGGNITISGEPGAPGGFIGAGGECLYTSAISGSEASRRKLTISGTTEFGDTGASAINPQGITLNVTGALLRDAFIGCEGWGGEDGAVFDATLSNCQQASMQGGTYNADPRNGGYYAYTSPTIPNTTLRLNLRLINSSINLGSGLRGTVTATESLFSVGDAATFQNGVRNTDIDVISIVDKSDRNPGFFLLGGAPGTLGTDDVTIRLALRRTAMAALMGFRHIHGSGSYGSFGPNANIRIVERYPEIPSSWAAFAPIYDYQPRIIEA